ncbi:unnamed protein product, partial [Musa hybrid cultivar]
MGRKKPPFYFVFLFIFFAFGFLFSTYRTKSPLRSMDDSGEIREKTNIANEADYEKRTFPIPFPIISSFLQRVSDQEGGGKSWFHLGEEGKTKNAINHLFRSELTETKTMVENDFPTVAAPRKPLESQNR